MKTKGLGSIMIQKILKELYLNLVEKVNLKEPIDIEERLTAGPMYDHNLMNLMILLCYVRKKKNYSKNGL